MKRILTTLVTVALLSATAAALDESWPRAIDTQKGRVTIYQPQAETFDGDVLEARAAVSVTAAGEGSAPVFGAVWLRARVETDRDARLVTVRSIEIPQARFPDASADQEAELSSFLAQEMTRWELTLDLDHLVADLELEDLAFTTAGLRNDPPHIVLSTEPAILVQIDGTPILEPLGSSGLKAVVNTPFVVLFEEKTATWYLSGGGRLWYSAHAVLGPWEVAAQVPDAVAALAVEGAAEPATEAGAGPAAARGVGATADRAGAPADPPKIVAATEPTELVVCAGAPSWSPIEGMELLYLDNSDSDVFLDIASQRYYVLLSGRWYRAPAVQGQLEWEHVPNDELPAPFVGIDPDSPSGGVLAHVAGTEQAREAVLDSAIPQTAAVRRDDASLQVEFDGEPQFVDVVDLTSVQYAVNTPAAVFKVAAQYYCCDQGVWYVASAATGPWNVAAEVPVVLYDLPASNPHYNVVYVRVYDVTPTVVYYGYTPGYLGCYTYHGCVVYGTGWVYRPWYGRRYYPRCWTWGLRVTYDPWRGWGVGVAFTNGPFTFGLGRTQGGGRYAGAWFGPAGYRPFPRPYVGVGYRKTTIQIDRSVNIDVSGRPRPENRPGTLPAARPADRANLYDRAQTRDRLAARPATQERPRPELAAGRANDVLTDRDGNVYRRDEGGSWQQRERGEWKPAENLDRPRVETPATAERTRPAAGQTRPPQDAGRPATSPPKRVVPSTRRPSTGGATRPQLERDVRQRDRGNQRSRNAGGGAGGRPATTRRGGRGD